MGITLKYKPFTPFSPAIRPYANFLFINGGMAIGLLIFYNLGWALQSMLVLLLTLLFACLCLLLEVILSIRALASGRPLLALSYGLVSVALFFADKWLLEQAE